jgi:hypothetical protein
MHPEDGTNFKVTMNPVQILALTETIMNPKDDTNSKVIMNPEQILALTEMSSTLPHDEATTEQEGKTEFKQHAKTETKKCQCRSYYDEDHEESNHVRHAPDDVARRREISISKKNIAFSGAGASSSSSLLEQTSPSTESYAVSPGGDLEEANRDQLDVAESPMNLTSRRPRRPGSERSEERHARPGILAVNSEGSVRLVKGRITSLVPSAAGGNETSPRLEGARLGPVRGGVEDNIDISGMSTSVTLVGAPQPEEKTQNRNWYYMIGIFLVVVVAAVGAGLAVALSGSDDDSPESESRVVDGPTPTDAQVQVNPQCGFTGIDPDITKLSDAALARYEVLLGDFAAQAIPDFTAPVNPDDYCTPTNLALIWLAKDDENSFYPEQQLINRYILGIFHVATNGFEWLNKIGWLTDVTECQWFGVTCDDGGTIITGLKLPDNGLKSTIPSEIGLLSGLQTLNLARNELVGLIPTTIDALSDLSKCSVWSW